MLTTTSSGIEGLSTLPFGKFTLTAEVLEAAEVTIKNMSKSKITSTIAAKLKSGFALFLRFSFILWLVDDV